MQLAKYMGRTWRVSPKKPYPDNPDIVMLEQDYTIIPRKIVLDTYSTGVHRTTANRNQIKVITSENMAAKFWGAQHQ